jgi:hypothetical protein
MATRYWVGGSGNWDATSTANWATSSGGAGGASAPTSADDVIFDANSNTLVLPFTVTVTGDSAAPAVCNDFSTGGAGGALDGAMTLAFGTTGYIDSYGSVTFPATNFSITAGATTTRLTFKATTTGKTFTTNGVSLGSVVVAFSGIGGAWTLGSAFTSTTTIFILNGTFDTGNYNITAGAFRDNLSSLEGTRIINLGSSTVTASASSPINMLSDVNLTFNADTSQITCSNASPTFTGGGLTFYNVSFTTTSAGTTTITGANTFNNLSITSRGATGIKSIAIGANQTVSGTLTFGAANTAIRRMHLFSSTIGTQRTITLNGTLATLADVDFRDIATAGTVGTWTGTRLGNALNNSGITFDAGVDKYWNLAAGGNWSATGWALSSGGGVAANNFPLAQDTVIIENTGLNTSATITVDVAWNIGTINASTRSNAWTFATGSQTPQFYKDFTLSSATTVTGTGVISFFGQGTTQTIDVNTATLTQPLTINAPTGTLVIAENTTTSLGVNLTAGTLDLNDNTLTCLTFASNNSNTRAIAFGTGNITVTGNAAIIFSTDIATNFTYTGTPTVNATYSGSSGTRTIAGGSSGLGGTESNALNFNITAGTDTVNIGANIRVYKNINFTGFSGTLSNQARFIFGNLTFNSGMTLNAGTATTTFAATSGTQTITSNGQTLDFPVTQDGVGGTVSLADNLTIGSTRTLTLTNGALDVNDKTLTTGLFSSNNSNIRSIDFGTNGTFTVNGGDWDAATSTGLSLTGTGTIDMTLGTAKTFAGGGATYPYTLNQGGLGTLTITGANTFTNISNTVQPTTIIFPASETTSVQNFTVSGTAGNLVTLNSSISGTQFTLALV